MSADSPRRLSRKGSTGHVVLPQPVSDPSIIDSVAGFIHEVIPQAYSSVLPGDSRESIAWARFEQADCNDPSLYPDAGDDYDSTPPLLLVLGYSNGVQVWSIASSGEAVEVLSWNQRVVRTLRFLPAPLPHPHSPSTDPFAHKRPLIALVDNSGPPPHFSTCSFISLHAGDQVKSIKFKNPICDVLANRRSIVITFLERIAVFDALTLEDRLTVTTCYPSPGVCPNPVALGSRWLAYADKRLVSWWRSLGGCDVEGAHGSYTASVLHAAKSLGKGLRGLSGHVASHLSGGGSGGTAVGERTVNGGSDASCTPGVVTVLDIEGGNLNQGGGGWSNGGVASGAGGGAVGENIVAHFVAHLDPIVALAFDPSGMLLLTVDKRGHRFHLFRIQPHLSGSSLSEVHQLYTLYRGDTSARIQDIAFSFDSRWVAVSSLRGTTHLFPITPYGGSIGVRTHTTPHVVNKLSRFHRSAGLSDEGGCGRNSPVPHEGGHSQGGPPLTPPLPHRSGGQPPSHSSVTVQPLAQLRRHYPQPTQAANAAATAAGTAAAHGDGDAAQVRVAACFAPPRASLPPGLLLSHAATTATSASAATPPPPSSLLLRQRRPLDSVYVMSAHGTLLQYDLDPRHITGLSKERISDDTAIELAVDAKAEWLLMSPPLFNPVQPPLSQSNPLLQLHFDSPRHSNCMTKLSSSTVKGTQHHQQDEHWLSQVEIVTHAGPHRRLWMGPQFTFKTYSLSSSDLDKDSVEVGTIPVQSNPINVPMRPPLLIESGSTSSLEQSPHLTEVYQNEFEFSLDHGESRLREDLADAMQESPSMPGRRWSVECVGGGGGGAAGAAGQRKTVVERRVNPLGTIIMVQQPPQSTAHELSTQLSRQSTDHLIVVAAESLATSSQKKKNKSKPQVPTNVDITTSSQRNDLTTSGQRNDVTASSQRNDITTSSQRNDVTTSSQRNESTTSSRRNDVTTSNQRNDGSTSSQRNDVTTSSRRNDVSTSSQRNDITSSQRNDITSSSQRKSSINNNNNNRIISCSKDVTSDDCNEKVVGKSNNKERRKNAKNDRNKSTNIDKLVMEKSINVDRLINADESITSVDKSIVVVDTSVAVVDKLINDVGSIVIDEKSITVDNSTENDSIECSVDLVKFDEDVQIVKQPIPESSTDCGSSRGSKRKSKNNAKKLDEGVVKGGVDEQKESVEVVDEKGNNVEDEVEILVSGGGVDKEESLSIFELASKPEAEVVKDKEYPALTSSVKMKRKCRTLGKKISKVVDDKQATRQNDEIDLLECHDHNLMDFPDLLLANVKVVDNSRRESIAKVVIETIEKDNMIKDVEEEEEEDKEETTDKDSSDDCLEGKVVGGGGGGKKRKNRKKEGGKVGETQSDSEVKNDGVVEEPKKLSWSQITSMGGKKSVGEVVGRQVEEDVIQPEIIKWDKERDNKNSTEDRGSVYESCNESVEECDQQNQCNQIEVANEVVADADVASADYQLCPVYSSEKESGDSGGKESADSGEKDVQVVSKKSRKQRKKRR